MPLELSQPAAVDISQIGIEILQASLGIGQELAANLGSIVMRGPNPRCGEMTVAEFYASDHGKEAGTESLSMIREDIDGGAAPEQALLSTFGRAAFTKDEHGGLKRRGPDIPVEVTTPQTAGLEKK